ncbi:MAG TPA: histidine phosphatase family protein [Thermoanaerobaculia bacterium]|nr:histidine phosphatase family protein [Thermoanaerobaculia bacterium]
MLVRIARHGESEGNSAGALQGSRFDTPLSVRGTRQAEYLAARLGGEAIDAVWASPMIRARETAAIVAAPLGLGVSLDGDLVEFDWGVWSGRPYNGAIEKEVSGVRARWRAGETELSPAGGESPARTAVRADRFLARLKASGASAPVIVAHGRFNRILMTRLLGRELGRMDEIRQRNGSLSAFEWDGAGPATPLFLDDVSHLPPEIQTVSVLSDSVR